MYAANDQDRAGVWQELEHRWHRQLSEFEKEYLVMRRLVGEIADELAGASWEGDSIEVARCELDWFRSPRIAALRTGVASPRPRGLHRLRSTSEAIEFSAEHAEALSLLLAEIAAQDEHVVAFRKLHLPEGLLLPADVEAWILAQAKKDGPFSQYVEVPIPAGAQVRVTREGNLIFADGSPLAQRAPAREVKCRVKTLRYYRPLSGEAKGCLTASAGVLDELRSVSVFLSEELRWGENEATVFVLTGKVVPLYEEIYGEQQLDQLRPLGSRLTLRLCPTVRPEKVAHVYAALRAQMLSGRYVRVHEKQAALVRFALPRRQRHHPWKQIREAWNDTEAARFPHGSYGDVRNLSSDYYRTRKALLSLAIDLETLTGRPAEPTAPLLAEPGRQIISARLKRQGSIHQLLPPEMLEQRDKN
jgi:hypothetical protein